MISLSYTNTSNILSTTITKQRKKLFGDILRNPYFKMSILKERIEKFLFKSMKCDDEIYMNKVRKQRLMLEKFYYKTILNDAVILNRPKYVELLIKCGAPMNKLSKNQMTPLEIAIVNNNYEICSMLLCYNCAQFQSRFSSHLIYAIYGGNNAEIQLLLLDYEVDVNVSFLGLSLLFIAIERSQFLIPHLLNHGADVNDKNTIGFILMNPIPVAYFKLVWDKFDYEIWTDDHQESIILSIIGSNTIPSDLWDGYLRTIIEDDRIELILKNDEPCIISDIVEQYVKRGFVESNYYDLICILLTYGCSVHFLDMHRIYNLLGGESIILKLLLHMDIQKTYENADFNFIRVNFCLHKPVNQLLKNLLYNMRIISMKNSYLDISRYFTLPEEIKQILIKRDAPKYLSINLSKCKGTVAPLLELARNKARDFICRTYSIGNSGQYYSVVNHNLLLPEVLKRILTFECPIYQNVPCD